MRKLAVLALLIPVCWAILGSIGYLLGTGIYYAGTALAALAKGS